MLKLTFLSFFLLTVLFNEQTWHYVEATSRTARLDQLEIALHRLNISTNLKLLDYFPNLKAKAVKVTDACYQPLLNYNGTVVANIFEDGLFTVVKRYFKVNFKRLRGLTLNKVLQRIKHLLKNIGKLAESIFECQRVKPKLKGQQQQQCLTSLGDMSPEEKAILYLPKAPPLGETPIKPESNSSKCSKTLLPGEAKPPPLWDWRNMGIITPARDQNPCGTCFIFSAVAAAESAWQRYNGGNTCDKFSEQAILNCIRDGIKHPEEEPCLTGIGGWPMEVYERMISFGATPLEQVPYLGKWEPCSDNYTTVAKVVGQCYHFSEFSENGEAGEELLKLMLYRNGPLAITIWTNDFFGNLCPGQVYNGPCTTENQYYHAVLLVGYDERWWHLKNSYGGAGFWGDAGFFRMPRGRNVCHVGNGYAVPLFEL